MFGAEPEALRARIDLEQWTLILKRFSEVLGIDIYTVDSSGKIITHPQHAPKIWALIRAAQDPSRSTFQTPTVTIQHLIQKSQRTHSPEEETDALGITHALIPIAPKSSSLLAYLVIGPLLVGSRKSPVELESVAKTQGWNLRDLEDAYEELKLLSFVGMKAALDLLSGVCNYLVQPTALKENEALEKEVASRSEGDDTFFSTLLNLALRATNANSGSVMMLNPNDKTLHIQAAHGLKEGVVRQTKINLGEGIAGWVAERNQSLLLNPDTDVDPSLQDRLRRQEIDSSIVMPLSRRNQVLGVLSVNSHYKANRLSSQSLDLLTQLAKLTMAVF